MASYSSSDRYRLTAGGSFAVRKREVAVTYSVIVSSEGDTFERLAVRYLQDPLRFWEIADLNPHIEWPNRIPTGTNIRIPV